MSTIREDLIPLIDEVRRDIVDGVAGLRVHTVVRRLVTWSGTEIGEGTITSVEDYTFDPVPRVRLLSNIRRTFGEYGKTPEEGDIIVDKLSLYGSDGVLFSSITVANNQDVYYLIDNAPYRIINAELKYLGREVHLRRMASR